MVSRITLSNKRTGWSKDMPIRKRRRLVLKSTMSRNMSDKTLEAARRMQAIANLSQDRKTQIEAKKDADHFFSLHDRFINK